MAGNNNFRKTTGSINSSWMRNALKSLGVASTDVIKSMIPATAETFSSASKLAADTARTIRQTRVSNNRIGDAIKSNPAVKMGQDFLRNAAQDLRSGKIYNTERMPESDDWDFGDEDFTFGDLDDDSVSPDVNINTKVVNVDNSATIKVMEKQMDYQIKSTKATIDTMVSVGSANLAKTAEIGTKVLAELGAINSNLAALVEYNSTNMTRFIEASIGYYEQNSKSAQISSNFGSNKVDQNSIFGAYGGLDFGAYKEYVKNNIKAMKDDSMIGSMVSMIIENKDMLVTNPLGMVLKGVMENAIPAATKDIMEKLDETVQNTIPILLERIGHLGDNDTSQFAVISKFISKAFGIKSVRETKFDYKKIEKGPIPFNGYANHAIVEIIPKYLRESTEYLRVIAEKVTGMPASQIRAGSANFNWQTGQFEKLSDTQNKVFGQVRDEVRSVYHNSTAGRSLKRLKGDMKTIAGAEAFDDALNQLFDIVNSRDQEINFKDDNTRNELLRYITKNREVRDAIGGWMKTDVDAYTLNAARVQGRNRQTSVINRMNEDRHGNNLAAVDGLDYDKWLADTRNMGKRGTAGNGTFSYNTGNQNGNGFNAILAGVGNVLKGVASGNTDAAWDAFTVQIGESFSKIGTIISDNFLKPIADGLFGQKDANGYLQGGVFSGVQNTFRDQFFRLRQAVTGQGYINSKGETINDLTGAEMEKTIKGRVVGIASWLKDAVSLKLFGDKDYDYTKDSNSKENSKKSKGLLGELRYKLATGSTSISAIITERANQFADWLFGTKDEQGNRQNNGLISTNTQNYFKENNRGMFAVGGAVLGSISGALTGGGLLGTLIGGPLAGAITGAVGSLIVKSDAWKKFIFGDPETGTLGLKNHFNNWKRNLVSNSEGELSGGKLLGGSAGMILGGGALGMLVGMPVLGAVGGLGVSILGQADNFAKWLFGEKTTDENGNEIKKHGIIGQFGNMLSANVFKPLIHHAKFLAKDLSTFLKYDVLNPVGIYIGEIGNRISDSIGGIVSAISGTMKDVAAGLKTTFVDNLVDMAKNVLSPLVVATKTAASAVVNVTKMIVSAPVKLLGVIASPILHGVSVAIKTVASTAFKAVDMLLLKPVNALVLKPLGGLVKLAGEAIAAPFKLVGGIVKKVSDTVEEASVHVRLFLAETGAFVKNAIMNSAPVQGLKHAMEFVHETAVEVISPIVEIGKAAINEVKESIKTSIKSTFKGILHALNPLTWIKLIGKTGKGIAEWILGRDAVKKVGEKLSMINPFRHRGEGEKKSFFGTIGDIWRRTGEEGHKLQLDGVETDQDGNVISSNQTFFDQIRNNKIVAAQKRLENRKLRDAWKNQDSNQKMIAKYTKNQRFEDTKENRLLAERMAGKKLDWGSVKPIKSEELKVEEEELKTQNDIRSYVADVWSFLTGKKSKHSKLKSDEEAQKQAEEAKKREEAAKESGIKKAGLLGGFFDSLFGNKKQQREERSSIADFGSEVNNIFKEKGFFGGIKDSFRYFGNWRKGRKIPGYADGTDNAAPGAAIVGEEGPELINMRGGESVVPLFGRAGKWLRDRMERRHDSQASKAFSLVSGKTSEAEKARIDEENEKAAAIKRQEEQTAAIKDLTKEQEHHHSVWDSIFSKKGLITGALILGIPLIKGLIDKIMNSGLINTVKTVAEKVVNTVKIVAEKVWNGISGIVTTLRNKFHDIKEHIEWIFGGGGLGDGKRWFEVLGDHITEACEIMVNIINGQPMNALAQFLFDENGNVDHQTGSRVKLTGMSAAGALAGLSTKAGRSATWAHITSKEFRNAVKNRGIKGFNREMLKAGRAGAEAGGSRLIRGGRALMQNAGAIGRGEMSFLDVWRSTAEVGAENAAKASADDVAQAAGAAMARTSADDVAEAAARAGGSYLSKYNIYTTGAANSILRGSADDVAKAAGGLGREAVEKGAAEIAQTVSKESGGILTKAKGFVDDFLRIVERKLGKNAAGLGSKIASFGAKLYRSMCNAKVIGPLVMKLGSFFTATAGLAVTVVGLAAKEVTWIALGAMNGATAAKRLFFTDNIDATMVLISTAIGAALGTTAGSVVDIINEVVASILGFDFISWIASELYKGIMHLIGQDDKAEALVAGQEQTKADYEAYQNERIGSQYEAMIATGQLDPSISKEEYIEGAKRGEYKADYQSYVDYNDDVHKSGFAKIGGAFKEAGQFWFGQKTTTYTDSATGNKYVDNGDGTMTMYDANGNKVGNIAKSAVDYKNMQSSTEKTGGVFRSEGFKRLAGSAALGGLGSIINPALGASLGIDNMFFQGKGRAAVKEGAKNLFGNIRTGASAIRDIESRLFGFAKNGDIDSIRNYKFQGEQGESSGVVNAVVGVMKLFNYPGALIVAAGKKIKDSFDKIKQSVQEGKDLMSQGNDEVNAYADAGDLSGMWSVGVENPGGILGAIFGAGLTISKLFHTPEAIFRMIGGKISDTFTKIADDYNEKHSDLIGSQAEVEAHAELGDVSEMWSVSLNDKSGIFGWMSNASLTISKLFNSPKAIFHMIGNKISDVYNGFVDTVKEDKRTTESVNASIWTYAEAGNLSGIWSKTLSLKKGDPLSFVWNIMFRINQFAASMVGAFHWVGNAVKEKFQSAAESVKWFLRETFGIDLDGFKDNYGGGGTRDDYYDEDYESGYGRGGRGGIPKTLHGHTYYSQNDPRWANMSYNGHGDFGTMGDSGCGPTAMSMVLSDIKHGNVSPTSLARFAQATGTRDSSGTNYNFIDAAATAYGVSSRRTYNPSATDILSSVASGTPTVLAGHGDINSPYTAAGHYIVANGIDSRGNIQYSDPRGTEYSGTINPYDLARSTNASWSFSGGRGNRQSRYYHFGQPKDTQVSEGGYGYAKSDCGILASDIVGIAINELGYHGKVSHQYDYERGSLGNGTAPGKSYGLVKYQTECGFPDGHWCNQFIYWLFKKAANGSIANASKAMASPWGLGLTAQANSMRAVGQTIENGHGVPKSGDIMFFWYGSSVGHIGIIERVEGEIAHCIEGNYGNAVCRTHHNWKEELANGKLYCIGRPMYDTVSNYNGSAGEIPVEARRNRDSYSSDSNVHAISEKEANEYSTSTSSSSGSFLGRIGSVISSLGSAVIEDFMSGNITRRDWKEYFKAILGGGKGDGASTLHGHTYYSQNDPRWSNVPYSGHGDIGTIGDSGCGPTAMSMVLSDIKNGTVSPTSLARFAQATGTRDITGTNYNFIDLAANAYGVNSNRMYNPSAYDIISNVSSGSPMILSGYSGINGPYTASGHYIVANGIDSNGNILYSDPRGKSYSGSINPYDLARSTNASWSFSGGRGKRGRHIRANFRSNANEGGYGFDTSDCGFTAADVVSIAQKQLGYTGKISPEYVYESGHEHDGKSPNGAGCTKYKIELGLGESAGHWCNIFILWLFYAAANKDKNRMMEGAMNLDFGWGDTAYNWADNMISHGQAITKNSTAKPRKGDIIFFQMGGYRSGLHMALVESVDGDILHTIEGNMGTDAGGAPGGRVIRYTRNYKTGLNSNMYCIGRPRYDTNSKYDGSEGEVSAEARRNTGSDSDRRMITDEQYKSLSNDERAAVMYNSLRSIGFSEMGALGAMGNMQNESSMLPERAEFDWSSQFPGYRTVQDPNVMNDFTTNVLFPQYARQGLAINKAAYSYNGTGEAPFFPGVGLIGWTGPRTKALLDYANGNNSYWGGLSTQLKFLGLETSQRKPGFDMVNASTTPEDAAYNFAKAFEGCTYAVDKKKVNAKYFYELLKQGRFKDAPGVEAGGSYSYDDGEYTGSDGEGSSGNSIVSSAGSILSRIGSGFSALGNAILEDLLSGNLSGRNWGELIKSIFSGSSSSSGDSDYSDYYDGYDYGDYSGGDWYDSDDSEYDYGDGMSAGMSRLYGIAQAYKHAPASMAATIASLSPSEQAIVRILADKYVDGSGKSESAMSNFTHSVSDYWSWKAAYNQSGSGFTTSSTWNELSEAEKDLVRLLAGTNANAVVESTLTTSNAMAGDSRYSHRALTANPKSVAQHIFLGALGQSADDLRQYSNRFNKFSDSEKDQYHTYINYLRQITGRRAADKNVHKDSSLYQWKMHNYPYLTKQFEKYPVLWEAVSSDESPMYDYDSNGNKIYFPDLMDTASRSLPVPEPGGFGGGRGDGYPHGSMGASINSSTRYALQSRSPKRSSSTSFTTSSPRIRSYHAGGFGNGDAGHYDYTLNEIKALLGVLVSNSNNLSYLGEISSNTSKFSGGGRGGDTIVTNNVVNNAPATSSNRSGSSQVQGRGNLGSMTSSEKVARAIAYGK